MMRKVATLSEKAHGGHDHETYAPDATDLRGRASRRMSTGWERPTGSVLGSGIKDGPHFLVTSADGRKGNITE